MEINNSSMVQITSTGSRKLKLSRLIVSKDVFLTTYRPYGESRVTKAVNRYQTMKVHLT